MKKFFKIILQYYLKIITKTVLWLHRPIVIVVSGSVNKSFVRDEIKNVLSAQGKIVRSNPKNFNTEIGLPLAILNMESGYNSYRRWLPVILSASKAVFQRNFPKYLVLELGVAQRGDMRYLLSIVNPKIAVITDITQRYIESFSGMDRLVSEYVYLARHMKRRGMLILNWDNDRVRSLKKYTRAKVLFFGQDSSQCDGEIKNIEKMEDGMTVGMRFGSKEKKAHIKRFGYHHAQAALIGWMIGEKKIWR